MSKEKPTDMLHDTVDEEETSIRKVVLTEKGLEQFEQAVEKYTQRIEKVWTVVDINLKGVDKTPNDLNALLSLKQDISKHVEQLENECHSYMEFLNRHNSDVCEEKRNHFNVTLRNYRVQVDSAMKRLCMLIQNKQDTLSTVSSRRSRTSRNSRISQISSATVKRAKAEALKVSIQFAEDEAQLKKKQAELEFQRAITLKQTAEISAEMDLLSVKREAAVLDAEASFLEEGEQRSSTQSDLDNRQHSSTQDDLYNLGQENPMKRTREYVESTSRPLGCYENIQPFPMNMHTTVASNEPHSFRNTPLHPPMPISNAQLAQESNVPVYSRTPPPDFVQTPSGQTASQCLATDFTQFLLKKELLFSRLIHFNDKPEFYPTWKNSFKSIMFDLKVTPAEEVDLLVKWTGPLSQQHMLSIKAANSNNPARALTRCWTRLEERYGCPEMMEATLKSKLDTFPTITSKDIHRLYDLSDIIDEINAAKEDSRYSCLLAYFDSSTGVIPIVRKLPFSLQEKWTNVAVKYMKDHCVSFPPFTVFADFIREQSRTKNNPSFTYFMESKIDSQQHGKRVRERNLHVSSKKTDISRAEEDKEERKCPLHNTFHSLNKCKGFAMKSLEERRKFLKDKNICFRCCESRSHKQRDCSVPVKCDECDSTSHPTALHCHAAKNRLERRHDGGEKHDSKETSDVKVACTEICGRNFGGKSCAKTLLVRVFPKEQPQHAKLMYAVIDDQSNRSLVSPEFFELFNIQSYSTSYMLSSCGGTIQTSGRKAEGFVVESYDSSCKMNLPTLIECSQVPNVRDEIPTQDIALHYSHLRDVARFIPPLDHDADIILLLGRDIIQAHHVLDQRIGYGNQPYAQKLHLGWAIIGETCLGKTHAPAVVNTYKTHLLGSGRVSLFPPCTNEFRICEDSNRHYGFSNRNAATHLNNEDFGKNVFQRTKDDEKPGMSVDDREFLQIMHESLQKDNTGNWVAPLPFRQQRLKLPNNRSLALRRANALDVNLQKNPIKKEHFLAFMDGILKNGHAEVAPPISEQEECWFLPIFGIYHPKKPDQLRAVFDSSAKYGGLSLNDVLLTGPDLTNSLLGVLLRFRKESVAIMGDIQQMFYCFKVREDHRNFLRFFWYEENDPNRTMIEFRMTVHVFGNSPSPSIATYGLRKTAAVAEPEFGKDVTDFVENNFYVDDGLLSLPTVPQAIDLMKRTQQALQSQGNLRLHKIASNHKDVLNAFPADDLAKGMKELEFGKDSLPNQRSLGLNWNLESDVFFFQVATGDKPYTKRGVLSTINSIFDPIGFLAPVVLEGKSLLRHLVCGAVDWDETLPAEQMGDWKRWKESLVHLEDIKIPRTYLPGSLSNCKEKSVHIFCDASELAIAAVGYLKTTSQKDECNVGFVMGRGKLAPPHGHTIPRLELCAAVLAVELACSISDHLSIPIDEFSMYSDSRVVLGYIYNTSRRFYTYVTNRVSFIQKMTKPVQWSFVPTERNPADQATRALPAQDLKDSAWIKGPAYLIEQTQPINETFEIIDPDNDKEVRSVVISNKTCVTAPSLGSDRFSRFSTWKNLTETFSLLKHIAESFHRNSDCAGWHVCSKSKTVDAFQQAELMIIKAVQREFYFEEYESLVHGEPLLKSSTLLSLDVFLDDEGVLRVGGRLNRSKIPRDVRNPVIIPGRHHIALLLVRHFHSLAKHQGRHITSGTIRNAGFWIIGGKRLISSVIHKCVKCRKLRGQMEHQKMADLPPERVEPSPPFTYVGLDTFGPWEVVTRRTRGGAARAKRWAILFTCLATRGIHIEVVEDMSSSAFINAFKRFVAIRGKVVQVRSDRGTNFVGATEDLQIDTINVEDGPVKNFLYNNGTTWLFNPPHSSHMGGVWERLIGVTRRILDAMLSEILPGSLTHEVLTTFLAEASAIVNSRPLVSLSTDPENPLPLSPSMMLTQKPAMTSISLPTVDEKNMYRAQWKRVQHLAEVFWRRWKSQYLDTLQSYRKWKYDRRNLSEGDVVLMRDNSVARNYWPMGIITKVFPSSDGKVRKVEVRVVYREGGSSVFTRPVTEVVLLLSDD